MVTTARLCTPSGNLTSTSISLCAQLKLQRTHRQGRQTQPSSKGTPLWRSACTAPSGCAVQSSQHTAWPERATAIPCSTTQNLLCKSSTMSQEMNKGMCTKGRKQGYKSKQHWHWPVHTAALQLPQQNTPSVHEAHPCRKECTQVWNANCAVCHCSATLPRTPRSRHVNSEHIPSAPGKPGYPANMSPTQQSTCSACRRHCWHTPCVR